MITPSSARGTTAFRTVALRTTLPVVGLALALAGCSGSSSTAASTSSAASVASAAASTSAAPSSQAPSAAATTEAPAPTSAQASPSPSGTVVTVAVKGKSVTPAPTTVKIKAGEEVTLVVTSDKANELHLHGIEKEVELPAGQAVTVKATYPDPGTYEVETHSPSLLLLRFEVR